MKEFINHLTAKNIRELSRTSSNMVLANSLSQTEIDTKDSTYRVWLMAKVSTTGPMEPSMRAIFQKA